MIKLYIDNNLVTFYADKDEQVLINRKIKDYRDIEKVFGDYTETFTIPANANNNIFKHYYDADINGGFDARVRVDAELYIDDVLFKRGYVNLRDVQIKDNRISSYTIQFFTEVPKLTDLFGEDELRDLDFSALDHTYNYTEVRDRIIGPFTPVNSTFETLFYPLISYKRRYFYNTSLVLDGETQTDLGNSGTASNEGVSYTEFKPAVAHYYIIQRIEAKYGITINSPIFNNLEYLFLLMSLGNTKGDDEVISSVEVYNEQVAISANETLFVGVQVTPDVGFEGVGYSVVVSYNNQEIYRYPASGFAVGTNSFSFSSLVQSSNNDLVITVESASTFDFSVSWDIKRFGSGGLVDLDSGSDSFSNTVQMIASEQFQDFKVIDFLKSFVNMFNLVIEPVSATEFNFIPITDYYSSGNIIDITDYVDTSKLRVSPGELVSGINLGYEKNETFLSYEYDKRFNRGFGSIEVELEDSNGKKLQGEPIEVELPFEKPVFERIKGFDGGNDITYGYYVDNKEEEFIPFHSLFFIRNPSSGKIIYLKNDSNVSEAVLPLIPVTSVDPQNNVALNFENEIDERTGQVNTKNLYSDYYRDYISDLFDPKRRTYNLEALLPSFIASGLKLNDRLIIGQRRYIINSFQHNLNTNEIKFELLNDIFTGAEAVGQSIGLERTFFLLDSDSHGLTVRATGDFDILSVSDSQGWTTSTNADNQVSIEVDENDTGIQRDGQVTVRFTDPSVTTITIFITQLL